MSTIASQIAAAAARSIARAAGQRSMSSAPSNKPINQPIGFISKLKGDEWKMAKNNLVTDGTEVAWVNGLDGKTYTRTFWTPAQNGKPPPDTTCPQKACELVEVLCTRTWRPLKALACYFN